MRQIGHVASEADARQFRDYLLTQGIEADVRPDGPAGHEPSFAVWIRHEDDVERSRDELNAFQHDPTDPRYRVANQAASLRQQAQKTEAKRRANIRTVSKEWVGPAPAAGHAPMTIAFLVASVAVTFLSGFGADRDGTLARNLMFCDPVRYEIDRVDLLVARIDPDHPERFDPAQIELTWPEQVTLRLREIGQGQVWRLVTPVFFHFGIMHLLFNGLFLFQIGGLTERLLGPWRFLTLLLVTAVAGNLGQALAPFEVAGFLQPGPNHSVYFGGLSGILYGVFTWLVVMGLVRTGRLVVPQGSVVILSLWFLLGATGASAAMGLMMANWAHGVGALAGAVLGLVLFPKRLMG